jgi:hypothetical protein
MTSPDSSGGVSSSVAVTAWTMAFVGSSTAVRISSLESVSVRGSPVCRSRPRTSASISSGRECEHVVLALDVRDDRLVELVAADADRLRDDDAAQRDDRHLGGAAADVDDHVPGRLLDRQSGTDRSSHRLLDQERLPRSGLHGGLEHGALLDLGHAGGDAHDDARLRLPREALHARLVDEVAQHRLGHLEVGDDAVLQWPDRDDRPRRAAEHALRLDADGQDALAVLLDGDDGRLDEHDPATADRDERVGGPEVYGHIRTPGGEKHVGEGQRVSFRGRRASGAMQQDEQTGHGARTRGCIRTDPSDSAQV